MFLGLSTQKHCASTLTETKYPQQIVLNCLGLKLTIKLKFDKNIKILCSKVNKKINDFSRRNTYISREQALSICNAVLLSNFNYCHLTWIFCEKVQTKRSTAHIKVFFKCSMKTMNNPLRYYLSAMVVLAFMRKIYKN